MSNLIDVERELLQAHFDRRPFYVRHALGAHPLFALERLVELAGRLPAAFVEYNAGNLAVGQDPAATPRTGLSPEETIRRIEHCGSWLVLKRVERDPAYGALLRECLGAVAAQAEGLAMRDLQGFVFVSSPNAVTPLHMDPEHNFLLQVRGTKTIRMWTPEDRYVVSERDLETFHAAFTQRNLAYREAFAQTAFVCPLGPGQGLHFPVAVPHWVQNGPEVSVSFSVTFRTPASERRALVYRANHRLRRLGLEPSPVGASPLRDAAKLLAARALLKARDLAGR